MHISQCRLAVKYASRQRCGGVVLQAQIGHGRQTRRRQGGDFLVSPVGAQQVGSRRVRRARFLGTRTAAALQGSTCRACMQVTFPLSAATAATAYLRLPQAGHKSHKTGTSGPPQPAQSVDSCLKQHRLLRPRITPQILHHAYLHWCGPTARRRAAVPAHRQRKKTPSAVPFGLSERTPSLVTFT